MIHPEYELNRLKTDHLICALLSSNNILHLFSGDEKPRELIKILCKSLTELKAYNSVWIALTDRKNRKITATESGIGNQFSDMLGFLEYGGTPGCMNREIRGDPIRIIKEPEKTCEKCPLYEHCSGYGVITGRIGVEDEVFGTISIATDRRYIGDPIERAIFEQLLNGISSYIYSRDLEEKKARAEAQLKEMFERLNLVIDSANLGLWDRNYAADILVFNRNWADMLGYPLSEIQGRKNIWEKLIHPDDFERVIQIYNDHLNGLTSVYDAEYRLLCSDGSWKQVHARGRVVLRDKNGRPLRMTGIHMDVDQEYIYKKALEETNRKLSLLNSITRHDIQNHLMAASGFLEFMKMEKDYGKSAEYLEKAISSLENIKSDIDNTRLYQDIGANKPDWQIVDNIIRKISTNGMFRDVTVNIDTGSLEVFADPLLEKVFFNIMENSLRHGESVSSISFSFKNNGKTGTLFIADNGTGIPEEMKERIFNRGVGKNTGFGLFLTREILNITDISIRESGTEGEGACFELIFPKACYRC